MSILLLQDPKALWLLTRGSGLVAFVLLTASVVLGVCGPVRLATPRWPRFALSSVHRTVALLALVVLGVHIATTIADAYTPISVVDVFVPFASPYRTFWLGLGTIATDLMLVVVVTSMFRVRLGLRAWKVMHWTTYACWPVALLHYLGTGTDAQHPLVFGLAAMCTAAVLMAIGWRLVRAHATDPQRRLVGGATALAVAVGIGAWAFTGPLQPGWAARAGTPKPTAAGPVTTVAEPVSTQRGGRMSVPFRARFVGTTERTPVGDGRARVELAGELRGAVRGSLVVVVAGPRSRGDVRWDRGGALLGPSAEPGRYTGGVMRFDPRVVQLRLTAPGRPGIDVRMRLDPGPGNRVTGVVRAVRTAVPAPAPPNVIVVEAPPAAGTVQAAPRQGGAAFGGADHEDGGDHDAAEDAAEDARDEAEDAADDRADAAEDRADDLADAREDAREEREDAREDRADDD